MSKVTVKRVLGRRWNPFVSVAAAVIALFGSLDAPDAQSILRRAPRDPKPYRGYRKPGRYMPHQGEREMARRRRQMASVSRMVEPA